MADLFLSILCQELTKERRQSLISGMEAALEIVRLHVSQSVFEQIEPEFDARIKLIQERYE